MQSALDGAERDAENLGQILIGQLMDEGQDQHLPVNWGQPVDCRGDLFLRGVNEEEILRLWLACGKGIERLGINNLEAAPSQRVMGPAPSNPHQPALHTGLSRVAMCSGPGRQERVLEQLLGQTRIGGEVTQVRQEWTLVARIEF